MEKAGYSPEKIEQIKKDVKYYEDVRAEIKLKSGDYIDLKAYEPAMRHLIDTYISAKESQTISAFDDMTLIELIVKRGVDAVSALPDGIKRNKEAVAETIENNMRKLIIDEMPTNPKTLNSSPKRALYDNLGQDEELTMALDSEICHTKKDGWRGNIIKEREVKYAIKNQKIKFETQERQSERRFVSGESHYYRGRRYLLNVIYHKAAPRVEIRKNNIDLYVREGSASDQREKVLTEWYRGQLKEQISALIDKWQKIIGVEVKDWGIKRMKTKWGTCTFAQTKIYEVSIITFPPLS
jgi:hypothetical protein